MAMDPYVPYLPDVTNGFVVEDTDWNGQWDTLADYLNSQVKGAIDTLQAAPAVLTFAQSRMDARLSLVAATPFSPADTSASTIRLCPFGGDVIGLLDPSDNWVNYVMAGDATLAVPSSVRELHDVWVYQAADVIILECTDYKSVVASNSPAAGKAIVINLADTDGIVVGDTISITDTDNVEEAAVTLVVNNTSITVDWLKFSYTTPTVKTNLPLEALVYIDGVPVQDDEHKKRYVGTIFTDTLGSVSDSKNIRGVANYYNRVEKKIENQSTAADFVFGSGAPNHSTWRVANDDKTYANEQIFVCCGLVPIAWELTMSRLLVNQTSGMAIGANNLVPLLAPDVGYDNDRRATMTRSGHFQLGRNVLRGLFHGGGSGTGTVRGSESQPNDDHGAYNTGTYSGIIASQ